MNALPTYSMSFALKPRGNPSIDSIVVCYYSVAEGFTLCIYFTLIVYYCIVGRFELSLFYKSWLSIAIESYQIWTCLEHAISLAKVRSIHVHIKSSSCNHFLMLCTFACTNRAFLSYLVILEESRRHLGNLYWEISSCVLDRSTHQAPTTSLLNL